MPGASRHSRRLVLTGAALGLGSALVHAVSASAAPDYSAIPPLPDELGRGATVLSRVGRKPYQIIDVSIRGDRTRLFVPHSAAPSLHIGAVLHWYFHANGSSYAALSGAFQYAADQAVDEGVISICPQYGGSVWVSRAAVTAHTNAAAWVQKSWRIGASFLRSNSGGGALLCWVYGNRLLPEIRGAYHASGVYDMSEAARRDPLRVLPAYDDDSAAVAATDPARLPQSAWAGTRLRITGSSEDLLVPLAVHGARLHALARPVAKEAVLLDHSSEGAPSGHIVPTATQKDMLDTFRRWLVEQPVVALPAPVVPGAGTYQNDSAFVTTQGTWSTLSSAADSGGSVGYSNSVGAAAFLRFSGTGVSWVSRLSPSSGINEVVVDGAVVATVDRYSPTTRAGVTVWTSGPLRAGEHTVTIRRGTAKNPAATGSTLVLDAFVVTSGPPPALPGAGTYENGSAAITTVGTWATLSSTADSGGSISYSSTAGASATLRFRGTRVRWVGRLTPSSGINEVLLDGVQVATVDCYSDVTRSARPVWTSAALPAGDHTVTIRRGSTRNPAATGATLILDAFVVV
ncbi:hypothetical protein [Rathayibacter tanaceti]|uniref:Uncharacterized protein n=2 Tax=Rathayibacter tanaceti TaxID=1671680 RepID=A0A166H7N9_9MICO|nr:hypothetical protein [Rathayibacter tanaceti]KZX20096.1 hypothetical protein ACH61_02798 [Rathayibacter tanaceti]QHC56716.1 hypothetical protein GSU10_14500 [Rathayibacter tanaceti]TCO32991.1 hypothetical protein EV639_11533 [Rathayibacter tanaceti]